MMFSKHLSFLIIPAKIRHQNKKINEILCTWDTGLYKPIIPRFHYYGSMHAFFSQCPLKTGGLLNFHQVNAKVFHFVDI